MAQPYPLPRETRSTGPLAFDGASVTYGPFAFKIFDTADVAVQVKAAGAVAWSNLDAVTVTKTTADPFSTFSVTFDDVHPVTSSFRAIGRRLHERSIALSKGGGLDLPELEKEISKQGSIAQELRRDYDETVAAIGAVGDSVDAAAASATSAAGSATAAAGSATAAAASAAAAEDAATQLIDPAIHVDDLTALAALNAAKFPVAHALSTRDLWAWISSDLSATLTPEDAVVSSAVDAGTNTITSVAHGLLTGHAVFSATTVNGLAGKALVYVIRVDADTFRLASSWVNAHAGTAIDLTGTAEMTLTRYVDPLETIAVVPPLLARDGSQGAWVRQQWLMGGYVYPEWAADVDTDATPAMFHAMNFATEIRLSSRMYLITRLIERINKGSVLVTGTHSLGSRFVVSGTGGFLRIIEDENDTTDRSGKQRIALQKFAAYTTEAGGGTGIYIQCDANSEPSVDTRDLTITGVSDATDYWTIGIHMIDCVGASSDKLWIAGREGVANSMSFGMVVENTEGTGVYQHYHNNLTIKWCVKAIAMSCTGALGIEGITLNKPALIGVEEGFFFDASGATGGYKPPFIRINGGEIDLDGTGGGRWAVYIINGAQIFIDGTLLYGHNTADTNALAIFENCADVFVTGGQAQNFASPVAKNGLWIKGTTTRVKVLAMHFDSLVTGIIVDSTASEVWIDPSCTFANVTTPKVDSGAKLLPSIMDSGTATVTSGDTVNFNVPFSRAPNVIPTHWGTNEAVNVTVYDITATNCKIYHNGGGSVAVKWMAHGA